MEEPTALDAAAAGSTSVAERAVDEARTPAAATRRRRRVPLRVCVKVSVPVLLAVLLMGAALWVPARGNDTVLHLDLTFSDDACCQLVVWLNDVADGPAEVMPITPGQRSGYWVPLRYTELTFLRLDPGQSRGASVLVHRIRVIAPDGEEIDSVTREELRSFLRARAKIEETPGGVRFTAEAASPTLERGVELQTGIGRVRAAAEAVVGEPHAWAAKLLVLGLLLTGATTLLPLLRRQHRSVLSATAVVLLVAAMAVAAALQFATPERFRSDVTAGVSLSAYNGLPKLREQLALWGIAGVAAAVAALGPVATRLLARVRAAPAPAHELYAPAAAPLPAGAGAASPRATAFLLGVPLAILALARAPDLRAELAAARQFTHAPNWDYGNILFWDYLVQQGLVPVRDFFYPYGLRFLFTLPAPWGPLLDYANELAFWGYILGGSYLVATRFHAWPSAARRFAFVATLIVVFVLAGLVPHTRYLGPLGAVLLFAGLRPGGTLVTIPRVLFAVALTHVVLLEPAQAAYVLPPVVFLVVAEQLAGRRDLRRLGADALSAAFPLLFVIAVLGAIGTLRGTVEFLSQLGAMQSAYASPNPVLLEPPEILQYLRRPVGLAAVSFWSVMLTLALGVHGLVRRHPLRLAYAPVAAVAIVGFMMLQKHVLRYGIETQIWLPATFGVVLWAALAPWFDRARGRAGITATVAAAATMTALTGGLAGGIQDVIASPGRLAGSVGALVRDRDAFAETAAARFAPTRFEAFAGERAAVELLRHDEELASDDPVWVLGDAPVPAMLLDRGWEYYWVNLWDAAPLEWQRELVGRLERTPPLRVLWNRDQMALAQDAVPHVVRSPVIFQWAVENLMPHANIETWEILRQRQPGEEIPLGWWRERLGHVVHLASVPAAARLEERVCRSGAACDSALVVEFAPGDSKPAQVEVSFTVRGLPFVVTFITSRGIDRYVVRLGRIWFWNAAADEAPDVRLDTIPAARAEVVRVPRRDDVLY